jgi:hypothetical protein
MFKTLFRYSRVSSRHANGPLAEQRGTFLNHLQTQGVPRLTLLRYADLVQCHHPHLIGGARHESGVLGPLGAVNQSPRPAGTTSFTDTNALLASPAYYRVGVQP